VINANGTFDVKVAPLPLSYDGGDANAGRFSLTKQFHGDLDAASNGEMLTAGDPKSGSAGYVTVERVSGTLGGRRGAFALQHSGTMDGGAQSLSVTVVPGSGSGELAGISGAMKIIIEGGKHSYEFEYALP
jgi:hypothetical protein